jgi:hypothetical protein
MPQPDRTCPDCKEPMEAGTVVDYRRDSAQPSEWVEGRPVSSMWTGRVKNDVRYEVTAYRCGRCGLLKLYADTPATARGSIFG